MNEQFSKRLSSFLWRFGNVMVLAGLTFIANNISDLGLPIWAGGMIGLVTAEITKYLNTK